MMDILIVDDEMLARQELRCLLEEAEDIRIVGECANALEAVASINRLQPDVVFLDIQMPRVSGLELLSMLAPERIPHIVFLTAHDEYALQAFEEHAFDYLLKPIDPARLEKTLHRLRRDRSPQNMTVLQDANQLKQIPCSGLNRVYLMKFEEIEYISSKQSGVYVVAANGQERFTELTLRTLEEKTPLIRCHRQYLINPDRIKEIQFTDNGLAEITTTSGLSVPVSRRFLSPLKDRLGIG
jgi:two-component system LytT family response regulator